MHFLLFSLLVTGGPQVCGRSHKLLVKMQDVDATFSSIIFSLRLAEVFPGTGYKQDEERAKMCIVSVLLHFF